MAKSFNFTQTVRTVVDLRQTATLQQSRQFLHTYLVKLADGRFFMAGGVIVLPKTVEIINAVGTGSAAVASMAFDRQGGHSQSLLGNGHVLVVGGDNNPTKTETWNPTDVWTTQADCVSRTQGGIATLSTGDALFFGGITSIAVPTILSSAQVYSVGGGTWAATGSLATARRDFGQPQNVTGGVAGKIFVCGGYTGFVALTSTELYDTNAGTWATVAPMNVARYGHATTKLLDGRILVSGGRNGAALSGCEIYDPVGNTWTTVASMNTWRANHRTTTLANGKVVAVGGIVQDSAVEIYDPIANTWTLLCGGPRERDSLDFVDGMAVGLINTASGDTGMVVAGGWPGFMTDRGNRLRLLQIVEPLTGAVSVPNSAGTSLAGPRQDAVQTIRTLQAIDTSIQIQNFNESIGFLVPPPPKWEEAALSRKKWDWTTEIFPDQKNRWEAQETQDPSILSPWFSSASPFGYIVPGNTNVGDTGFAATTLKLRNTAWARIRVAYVCTFGAPAGALQLRIYDRIDDGSADGVVELTTPVILTMPASAGLATFVSPPIPPGFHRISFAFQTQANFGEVAEIHQVEIVEEDNPEWTSRYEDFMGTSVTGAEHAIWNTLGTGTVLATATALGVTELTALAITDYAAIIGTPGFSVTAGKVPSFETNLTIVDATDVVIEAGLCGAAENPAGTVNYTKFIYDSALSANWRINVVGPGITDTGVPVSLSPVTLRIEIDALHVKAFIDGKEVYSQPATGPAGAPFVQVTNTGAVPKVVQVDWISMTWLRRIGTF